MKNIKKYSFIIIAFFCFALVLTGCGNNTNTTITIQTGSYKQFSYNYYLDGELVGTISEEHDVQYTFNEDKIGYLTVDGVRQGSLSWDYGKNNKLAVVFIPNETTMAQNINFDILSNRKISLKYSDDGTLDNGTQYNSYEIIYTFIENN